MVRTFGDVIIFDSEARAMVSDHYRNVTADRQNMSAYESVFGSVVPSGSSPFAFTIYSLLGLLPNLLIVYLSFFSKHLTEDFRILFGNLAAIDAFYSGFLLAFAIKLQDNLILCTAINNGIISFSMSMIVGIFLVTVHRYMVIYEQNADYFNRKRLLALCSTSYSFQIWWLLTIFVRKFIKYHAYGKCYLFAFPYELVFFSIPITPLCIVNFYLVMKLKVYLSRSMANIAAALQKTKEQVKQERSIVRAMLIQGLLPFFSLGPSSVLFISTAFWGHSILIGEHRLPILNYSLQNCLLVLHWLNPFFDSMATLFVIQPYYGALKTIFSWPCRKNNNKVNANPADLGPTILRQFATPAAVPNSNLRTVHVTPA